MKGHITKKCKCQDRARCSHPYYVVHDLYEDGKRRRKWTNTGSTSKRKAEGFRSELLSDMERGAYVEPSRDTLADYLASWLDGIRVAPSTRKSYTMIVRTQIVPHIGNLAVPKLTPQHLDRLYRTLEEKGGKGGKALSARSVRYAHTVLRKALADGVRKGLVARNVADAADPPRPRRREMSVWGPTQLRTFLRYVEEDRMYAAWHLAGVIGMRRGEILGLRWEDVDLDAAKLTVVQTIIEDGNGWMLSTPKTDAGWRSISLDPRTVAVLRRHRVRQNAERLAVGEGWSEHGLVFTREDRPGEPVNPRFFSRWYATRASAASLPYIRLHGLRHTAATVALKAGVHPKVVQERLGHASITITLALYSHVLPELQEEAAVKIDATIFGDEPVVDLG